ncbi:MAG: alkaline phosphatase [Victivallaceae bacterium]|nr:alkaline phosphatase [Victivallaceae bacterium]
MFKNSIGKKLIFVFIAVCGMTGVLAADLQDKGAKYVFLFIGDGMGRAHIEAAEKAWRYKLWMNTLPVKGSVDTWAYGGKTTDSAAAVTAMACGRKTRLGVLGLDHEEKPLETVAEMAKKQGWKVGIVSNAPLNHATPAGFYAHQLQRSMYEEIACDLAASGFEYFGGGSLIFKNGCGELTRKLLEKNYVMLESSSEMPRLDPGKKYIVHAEMPYVIDNKKNEGLSLADYTALGIRHLYTGSGKSKGFFLMVEGGKIDWCAHSNDGGCMVREVKAFDDAVKVAVDFWKKHPRSTTIVVTADHETGGLRFHAVPGIPVVALLRQQSSYKVMNAKIAEYKKGNSSFAETVSSVGDNYKLKNFSPEEFSELHESWKAFTGKNKKSLMPSILYSSYKPLLFCLQRIFNCRCGLEWTTTRHSRMPVPLMAGGVGSELFSGHCDNTQIALKLKSIIKAGK